MPEKVQLTKLAKSVKATARKKSEVYERKRVERTALEKRHHEKWEPLESTAEAEFSKARQAFDQELELDRAVIGDEIVIAPGNGGAEARYKCGRTSSGRKVWRRYASGEGFVEIVEVGEIRRAIDACCCPEGQKYASYQHDFKRPPGKAGRAWIERVDRP